MLKILSNSAHIEIQELNMKNDEINRFSINFKINEFNGKIIFFDQINDIQKFFTDLKDLIKGNISKAEYLNFEENINIVIEKNSYHLDCFG